MIPLIFNAETLCKGPDNTIDVHHGQQLHFRLSTVFFGREGTHLSEGLHEYPGGEYIKDKGLA